MKKIYTISSLIIIGIVLQSGMKFSSEPPNGLTGATGTYCNNCHFGNAVNVAGGSVTVSGLPASGGYVAGQSYPFSLTITHSAANRTRWGFSIAARSTSGTAVGTFSSSNPNAALNGNTDATNQELSHNNAPVTAASNTYTFTNLVWTAPPTGSPAVGPVTFYYVGNAANGAGSSGDFIYASSSSTALPIHLKDFTASVLTGNAVALKWKTASEQNSDYFDVEKSDDGQFFFKVAKVFASGSSTAEKTYSYLDKSITSYNKPVFYRLKLVDKDGTYKLSKTVSVQLKNGSLFVQNLYPTMVRSNGNITAAVTSDAARPLRIDVVDIAGRLLKTYNEKLVAGDNQVDFRLPVTLPANWIFIRFTSPGFKQVMPLVVNK